MRLLRSGLLLAVLLVMAVAPRAFAQDEATPAAGTPTAGTPVATDVLSARLGGSLQSFEAVYGTPDFTSDGLVRYDSVTLNGISTILVVYYDDLEQVTRIALVYPTRPDILTTTDGVLATAATVDPTDGTCKTDAISTEFGNEVYPCHSSALESVFTDAQLEALGVSIGTAGDYSIAVDPLPDAYFELIVQLGTDGTSLAPTPVPGAPTAGPTPTLAEQYPNLIDPSDLMDGDVGLDEPLSFTGEILTLQVAEFGKQYHLGQDESLGVTSLFQVRVPLASGSDDQVIFVGFSGDATGLAIGDQITVYGTNYGTQCFENAMKVQVCQPLIAADMVVEG